MKIDPFDHELQCLIGGFQRMNPKKRDAILRELENARYKQELTSLQLYYILVAVSIIVTVINLIKSF